MFLGSNRLSIIALVIVVAAAIMAYRGLRFEISGPDVGLKCFRWVELIRVSRADLEAGREAMARATEWSRRKGSYALVVDKSAYSLIVLKNGDSIATFPVELGADPDYRKERQGDSRTPEGLYRIIRRRDIGQTRFYRAFLIDYPNAGDREAGRTGGAIEIHGYGSGMRPSEGGYDWTEGCAGLKNAHIDSLFGYRDGAKQVGVGTPVAIVYAGSLPDDRYSEMIDPSVRGRAKFPVPCVRGEG